MVIVKDMRGQAAGDGYVQFEKEGDMKEALDRHMEKIGHRYDTHNLCGHWSQGNGFPLTLVSLSIVRII